MTQRFEDMQRDAQAALLIYYAAANTLYNGDGEIGLKDLESRVEKLAGVDLIALRVKMIDSVAECGRVVENTR